jgi:hypothetical protein
MIDIYIEEEPLNVVDNGIHKTEEGYLIVTEKDDFLSEGVVFQFYNEENPNDPAFGIVKKTDENDAHKLLYVSLDPEHKDDFKIVNGKPIIIWGKIYE